jgi:D-alanyl-D-alanine carboxypeptidase
VLGGESASWRDARMMSLFDQAYDRSQPSNTMVAGATQTRKPLPGLIPSAQAGALDRPYVEQGDGTAPGAMASLTPSDMPRNKPAAAAKPGSEWAIQVGAFSRTASAHLAATQAKSKLPKTLKSATVNVSPNGDLYRARLIGLSEKQAAAACKQLIDRGTACITISPDQIASSAG